MPSRNKITNKSALLSLPVIAVFSLSVALIFFIFCKGISGNDFWWHIKVGEWIVGNGKVPTTDVFSWYGTINNIPWTAHEWLADVIFYLIYSVSGETGIFLLSLIAACLMVWLSLSVAKESLSKNPLLGCLFFVMFSATTGSFFYGRPHLFSFFLLFVELKILFSFVKNQNSKGIYLIPLLTCLWSNLHGGCASISYVLCAVFFVSSILNCHIGRIAPSKLTHTASIKLLTVTLLSILAILVNPVGLDVLVYPYKSFGDPMQMTMIAEWDAPDAKNMGNLILFFLPIAFMLLGFFAEEKRIRLIDLAIMGFFIVLFLRSIRFIMFWYIAAVFCAFPYMPKCKISPVGRKTKLTLISLCSLALALFIGFSISSMYRTRQQGNLISKVMTEEAIAAVKKESPARVFNDYNLGEALIYHDLPVFFDARADLYAYENIMADGVSLMFLEQANANAKTCYADIEQLMGKYNFDSVLILRTRPLYSYMISHPDRYESLFEDESVAFFKVIQ